MDAHRCVVGFGHLLFDVHVESLATMEYVGLLFWANAILYVQSSLASQCYGRCERRCCRYSL